MHHTENSSAKNGDNVVHVGISVQCSDLISLSCHLQNVSVANAFQWHCSLVLTTGHRNFLDLQCVIVDIKELICSVFRMKHCGRRVPHTKRRTIPIPPYVKRLYKSPTLSEDGGMVPSFAELCEAACKARNAKDALKPMQRITYDRAALEAQQQQDEVW